MITDEFKKIHDVKNVCAKYVNHGGSLIRVKFNDGREFKQLLTDCNYYNVLKISKKMIVDNSISVQRRKKIDKLIEKI